MVHKIIENISRSTPSEGEAGGVWEFQMFPSIESFIQCMPKAAAPTDASFCLKR